ncbi:DUF397 domain-containing protein [Kibdelosporangium aridum]|uniref:DUF397 domain-containing protein n=1 Tax=Kibdelosporangium aridum TaxID=2030 RepID=A0A428YJN8_KIBAR|nr:DUF397 domain-containing protein [Kibdelosporangium aridum]RSM67795.1 DUF397 domain-containing protein [Kibdelosporangium aridum]
MGNISGANDDREGWYKSSYSGGSGGSCVEVKSSDGEVLVRDSKNRHPGHPVIGVPRAAWCLLVDTLTNLVE